MKKAGWAGVSVAALALLMQAPMAQAQAANGVGSPFELTFWQSIGSSEDASLYEAYLQQYPQGTFAALARAKVQMLRHVPAGTQAPLTQAATAAPAAAQPPATPVANPVASPAVAAPAPAPSASSNGPALAMASPVGVPGGLPVSAAAAAGAGATLGQMLADLAHTQETPAAGTAAPATLPAAVAPVSPISSRYALPPHPQMVSVPELILPASFCSAEDRNRYHDTIYRPAVDAAKRNNDAAVAYLKTLQGIYDGYDLGKDTEAMNALAAEARAYQADAATTFSQQAALVRAFDELMAVPVAPCAGAK
ncbi:hypothetical protein [Novosphingobium olei]|uniref:Uncharacterized protein n=1 Tax=Novosphingobium olei TaxID=2728851 RepID=A0A7Y0BLJ7_9SPHN|nr:hypothetical protein [Novosphingobium olei]NML92428.1 hypothetical protein [Novosphingobium olei]